MLALDVARVEAGLLLDRRRLLQQQEGADRRRRSTRRTRWGSAGWSASTRGGSSASGRSRDEHARGPRRQVVGLEIDWTEVERSTSALGLPPAVGATASRVAVPVYRERPPGRPGDDDDVVAGAEEDDRARDRRPAALRGRARRLRDRGDGRSRAPPRRRDGRGDAVLQSAAEDGDAAGCSRSCRPARVNGQPELKLRPSRESIG